MESFAAKRCGSSKTPPLSDPIEYEIMGYRIALRKSEAELIEVSLPSGGTAGSRDFRPAERSGTNRSTVFST